MKLRILALTGIFLTALPFGSEAQISLTVHKVSTQDEPPLRYPYDGALVVPVGTPNETLRPLRVRVFSGTRSQMMLRKPDADNCIRLDDAWVYEAKPDPGGWHVAALSPYWLNPVGDNAVADGHYTLVFEESADVAEVLRIRKEDLASYLSNAIDVIIEKTGFQPADFRRAVTSILVERQGVPAPVAPLPCTRVTRSSQFVMMLESNPCDVSDRKRRGWLRLLFN